MNQTVFAKELGISRSTIIRLENGDFKPSYGTQQKFEDFYQKIKRGMKEETMDNFFDFHSKDQKLGDDNIDYIKYCEEKNLEKESDWMPFLSFPITNRCNFSCIYCGQGGEATSSNCNTISLKYMRKLVQVGLRCGVKKFRLTGGEPFLHPDIHNIIQYFSGLGYFTLVNTNGSLILKHKVFLSGVNKNIKFAVSLDTLRDERLERISSKNCLQDIIAGLRFLKEQGLLLRVNMVVNKINRDEVFDIIKLCNELSCDMKILDVVSVPVPFGSRDDFYEEVNSLEREMQIKCDAIYSHEYTRGFGTPCVKYKFENTFVTVKNSVKGSHYDRSDGGLCDGCVYFPCHEGLYDLFALSDGRICACRWSEDQNSFDAEQQIKFLVNAFKKSRYHATNGNSSMKAREELRRTK